MSMPVTPFLFHIFSSCCSNTAAAAFSIASGIIAILVALLGIIGAIALSRILIGLVSYETETKGVEYMGSNVYWFISLSVVCSML